MRDMIVIGIWLVTLCLLALGIAAVTNSDAVSLRSANGVPLDAIRAIRIANNDWLPAIRRQDASTLAEPYAADAVFVTRAAQSIVGQNAISEFYFEAFHRSPRIVDGWLIDDGLVMQGGLVLEWGHSHVELQSSDGNRTSREGAYLTVWRRNPAGSWKIIRNLTL
jgi:ketosteroid isomerase-like protein